MPYEGSNPSRPTPLRKRFRGLAPPNLITSIIHANLFPPDFPLVDLRRGVDGLHAVPLWVDLGREALLGARAARVELVRVFFSRPIDFGEGFSFLRRLRQYLHRRDRTRGAAECLRD